jgi:hypothetical protein
MQKPTTYWQCAKPSNGRRWADSDRATVIDDPRIISSVFHMYRRYVKQWNDIELDKNRSLSEHTHKVLEANVISGRRRFSLHSKNSKNDLWILEVLFARSFSEWHPGMSCGKNPFRTTDDIKGIYLHWRNAGKEEFQTWLTHENEINKANSECTEYMTRDKAIQILVAT